MHVFPAMKYSCFWCDYKTDTKKKYKEHTQKKHTLSNNPKRPKGPVINTCDMCVLEFKTKSRLFNHICRSDIKNPTYRDYYYYTKNWFDANGCIPLFSSTKKQEVVILHSKVSWASDRRCLGFTSDYNDQNVVNLESDRFLINGEIDWPALCLSFN